MEYDDLRKYREKNHAVKVKKKKSNMYDHEYELSITHNGYQWDCNVLSEEEVKMVIKELQNAIE